MGSTLHSGGDDTSRHQRPSGEATAPPRLSAIDSTPRYELATVVHVLGVRRMTLLSWEQQLGMPTAARASDEADTAYRYSERDLVALVWIRDRILSGIQPSEAITLLLAAQDRLDDRAPHAPTSGSAAPTERGGYRARINTEPLRHSAFGRRGQYETREAPPGGGDRGRALPRGPESLVGGPSGPQTMADAPETLRPRRASGPTAANPRALMQPLLRAFGALDSASANQIVSEALAVSSVEGVCVSLLQPALNRIGDLWAHREITMPEERFALNYIRGFLFSHFHAAHERPDMPMIFVGCGPHEPRDIGALMLATFWRIAGLRVIYLGPDVDGPSLVQEARARRPALVALTITSAQRVRALSRIAKEIQQIPAPSPVFAFGGPAFSRHPELQRKVIGMYLGDDATTATWHVRRLLGIARAPVAEA
ncbi:MAG: cobalamin B12-binding domain-containing protein [Ktedonobacterales bacterium]|nr:cobalamin B12-binding domain-containing protein [Ktedonobacterales bacterium]